MNSDFDHVIFNVVIACAALGCKRTIIFQLYYAILALQHILIIRTSFDIYSATFYFYINLQ